MLLKFTLMVLLLADSSLLHVQQTEGESVPI